MTLISVPTRGGVLLGAILIVASTVPLGFTSGRSAWAQAPPAEAPAWVHEAEFTLGAPRSGDLGNSVALSADGRTALLGNPQAEVNGGGDAGAVEVVDWYKGLDAPTELNLGSRARGWGTPGSVQSVGDQFGLSVALSADGDTALVGVPYRDSPLQPYAGAAEVFRFRNGRWGAPTRLSLSADAAGQNDNLGLSVALSGDGNTALVGAPGRTVDNRQQAGAAEVFRFSDGSWSKPVQLSLGSSSQPTAALGWSVGLSGDGATALVGAQQADAEIFHLGAHGRSAPLGLTGSYGSLSVALSSDGSTALVGQPTYGTPGQIQAFRQQNGTWGSGTLLTLPSSLGYVVGAGVAVSGDGDTALIGTPYCWESEYCNGAVAVFQFDAGEWRPPSVISGMYGGENLGQSVALSGDGDTALVGAPSRQEAHWIGAVEFFTAVPGAVAVTVSASGVHGFNPPLKNLPPNSPAITYSPTDQAGNIAGSLTCATNAKRASPATIGAGYAIMDCSGLLDPGHAVVYNYLDSAYAIRLASVRIRYAGPPSVRHGANVTFSARLLTTTGKPIRGRVLHIQIGKGPALQSCDTDQTGRRGLADCRIKHVLAHESRTRVQVSFAGDSSGPNFDFAPGKTSKRVSVVE